jgi:hypothetical protein
VHARRPSRSLRHSRARRCQSSAWRWSSERASRTRPLTPVELRRNIERCCCWWSGLRRNAVVTSTGVFSWWRRLSPYDPA